MTIQPEYLIDPAKSAEEITPGPANLNRYPRAVYVGIGGNLDVEMFDGTSVSFQGVPTGSTLSIVVKKVLPSSTADGIIGLY